MLMLANSARDWAKDEFGGVEFDDSRWRTRLLKIAARAARRPSGRVTEVFLDAAERQGAYGLLESKEVTAAQLSTAMFKATALRCAEEEFVFVAVDGSSLSLTDAEHKKGFGFIGARQFGARGLKVINALAVSLGGVTLGLLSQIWWTRTGKAARKGHQKLPVSKKETRHWLAAMKEAREQVAQYAPKT